MASYTAHELLADKLGDAKAALNEGIARHHSNGPIDMAVLRARLDAMLSNPIIESADMYKTSHKDMYPDKMTQLQAYGEARIGSKIDQIVAFGMQIVVNEWCGIRITQRHIEEAAIFFKDTFGTDDIFARVRPGWQSVVDNGGALPVVVRALPEGTVVPPGTPLFTIESTDPSVPWMANFLETRLSHLWYTITVASVAFKLHQEMAMRCLKEGMTAEDAHTHASILGVCDFGLRGVECTEAGARGGMAALLSSKASDNTAGMYAVGRHYSNAAHKDIVFKHTGSSIAAAEHSTITAHGKDAEKDAYTQILNNFPTGPVSIVLDSYDYRQAVSLFCTDDGLKLKVMERYDNALLINSDIPHTVVLRPDSGDMIENVVWTLQKLYEAYGGEDKNGFKTLHPCIRIIQGDGIDLETYPALLDAVQAAGFSVTNLVAGSGGGLLQKVNRDTIRFAIKANLAVVDGQERGLQKETVGKTSKRGRLTVELEGTEYKTFQCGQGNTERDLLGEEVFRDGASSRTEHFDKIRMRVSDAHLKLLKASAASVRRASPAALAAPLLMALNLTLDECIRVKASLDKATASEDHGALKDILASLKVADTTGRLKVISDSKVGHAIKGLMKYEGNSEVRAMAAEVKNMWAARAAASKKTAAKPEDADTSATSSAPAPAENEARDNGTTEDDSSAKRPKINDATKDDAKDTATTGA